MCNFIFRVTIIRVDLFSFFFYLCHSLAINFSLHVFISCFINPNNAIGAIDFYWKSLLFLSLQIFHRFLLFYLKKKKNRWFHSHQTPQKDTHRPCRGDWRAIDKNLGFRCLTEQLFNDKGELKAEVGPIHTWKDLASKIIVTIYEHRIPLFKPPYQADNARQE